MMLVIASLAFWLAMWWLNQSLVSVDTGTNQSLARTINLAVPIVFGITLLVLWEGIIRGLEVPTVLLPPPTMIWERLINSLPILWADFQQTFLKAVLAGYVLGCGSGFLVALAIDRSPFLQKGLLPLGNFVSALPIIGVAPIMVMWFGCGRQHGARPDAHLCQLLVADPHQAAAAHGRPVHLQRIENQFHPGAHWRHRG